MEYLLIINPGATSTKIALFNGEQQIRKASLEHDTAELAPFPTIASQKEMRAARVQEFLSETLPAGARCAAVVGRGGLLKPLASGTWLVTEAMLADLERAERGEHASNLGAAIAWQIAQRQGCPAYVVDPVAVDELDDVARLTGVVGVERQSLSHALNMKAVAKRHAKAVGRPYGSLRLVVAHLGTGISLSAHRDGRMVDVINPKDEGPISPDRAGSVPSSALLKLCFAQGATEKHLQKRLFGDGGLFALLGTRDVREALERAEKGDDLARRVVDAMCYQVGKCIGEMATVLCGKVDRILLTGGICYNGSIVEAIRPRVEWIAPVEVFPGEDELQALAEGAVRVLRGEETALVYA